MMPVLNLRWHLFHLFGGKVMRFSDLERAIPNITQKMLPSSFQETERCFYICGGGCGRAAFRHTYFLLTHFFVRTSHFASMLRNFWLCNCPGETSSNFPTTRLLHWRSIMTMTYPFPVSGDEFKGKRVLVTGGTKGMGQAMVRRF